VDVQRYACLSVCQPDCSAVLANSIAIADKEYSLIVSEYNKYLQMKEELRQKFNKKQTKLKFTIWNIRREKNNDENNDENNDGNNDRNNDKKIFV